jgi:hypothetical protein
MESKNAHQAFFAENSPKCSHGFPDFRTIDDEHQEGLRIIMKWLREQKEAEGNMAGVQVSATAIRFMEGYPELIDQTTINILIQYATDFVPFGGDWSIMAGASCQIVVAMEQWGPWYTKRIGASNPYRTGGPSTDEENLTLSYATLIDLATSNREVILFLAKRITCSCLKELKKKAKALPKLGRCAYSECSRNAHNIPNTLDCKLLTCAGCNIFCYCCKDCQVKDWPNHKGFCRRRSA